MGMPNFLAKRWHGMHTLWAFALQLLLVIIISVYHWVFGLMGLVLCGAVGYYTWIAERAFRRELYNYVGTLSHRVKRAGTEVMTELPIGMLLYNEDRMIEWHNPYVGTMLKQKSVIGGVLADWFPALNGLDLDQSAPHELQVNDRVYRMAAHPEERLLYFTDVTDHRSLAKRYEEEKPAIGILMLDNLEEATSGMDDQSRNEMVNRAIQEINEWAQQYGVFLKRLNSDRYMLVMNQGILKKLEHNRFELLDDVREQTFGRKLPITISMGIAAGSDSLIELGQIAQTGLDIALGRGGDQVAIKAGQRLTFYGGKSNAVEKRTRVRARVISHALRDLIRDSDKVVIMGHRFPDMDSIGAAIGVLKAARLFHKEGYIVLEGLNPSIERMMHILREDENLYRSFVTPEQAMQLTTSRTLAVVVDTHQSTMVKEPRLLQQTHRIFVVDHHRRGEHFINEAVLVYMEPYASSTCELVTELLQYIHDSVSLDVLEATALLAGITVDTKSFALRTGARTFEAASFLRRHGADSMLIQRMLKEDLDEYILRAEIIKHAEVLHGHIAFAVSDRTYTQLMIAQAADTLLNMTGIIASFVICQRPDGLVGISARSLGQMNVQVIMEQMGGGGHFTNAAAQLPGTVEEAETRLKEILDSMEIEEGLSE